MVAALASKASEKNRETAVQRDAREKQDAEKRFQERQSRIRAEEENRRVEAQRVADDAAAQARAKLEEERRLDRERFAGVLQRRRLAEAFNFTKSRGAVVGGKPLPKSGV